VLKGLLAGGITMGVAAVFPEPVVFPFYSTMLGAGAGVGLGIAMGGPNSSPTLHWLEAFVVIALGLIGLWIDAGFLVGAWIIHGIWCLCLPMTLSEDDIPEGYPAFAFGFSLVSASFVTYLWAAVAG
jgi:hypothetical protein